MPIGVYDPGILCGDCETLFGEYDDYGAKVLLSRFDELFSPVYSGAKTIAFESTSVDQDKLLRFIVSVLWRASVSTLPFYSGVDLAGFANQAARVVLNPDQEVPSVFEAVLWRWHAIGGMQTYAGSIANPVRQRIGIANVYRLYLGQTMTIIKVSGSRLPPAMESLRIGAQSSLFAIAGDFASSKDFETMVSIVRNSPRWPSKRKPI